MTRGGLAGDDSQAAGGAKDQVVSEGPSNESEEGVERRGWGGAEMKPSEPQRIRCESKGPKDDNKQGEGARAQRSAVAYRRRVRGTGIAPADTNCQPGSRDRHWQVFHEDGLTWGIRDYKWPSDVPLGCPLPLPVMCVGPQGPHHSPQAKSRSHCARGLIRSELSEPHHFRYRNGHPRALLRSSARQYSRTKLPGLVDQPSSGSHKGNTTASNSRTSRRLGCLTVVLHVIDDACATLYYVLADLTLAVTLESAPVSVAEFQLQL
ncbi:hypothetical protein EDB86DRAFT_2833604 [Lactarius hatsudake]|nr:hypothetical protein EDB86DRAFT_2833604 [Lactarius hatsudake]